MRKRTESAYFTFLRLGIPQQSTASDYEVKGMPQIAIPHNGEWVSICGGEYGGEQPSAVFYTVEELTHLRDTLDEVIDIFQKAILNAKEVRRINSPMARNNYRGSHE